MTTALLRPPSSTNGPLPPTQSDGERGGGSGWVTLTRAANDIEASLMSGRLHFAGIESTSIKDRSGPSWLFGGSDQWAPVTILVRSIQLTDARIVLAEIAFDQPAALKGTPRVIALPDRRTALLFWATALALGLLLTGVALAKTGAAMHNCDLPIICVEGGAQDR